MTEIVTEKKEKKPLTDAQKAKRRIAQRSRRIKARLPALKKRAAEFRQQLVPFIKTYGKDLIEKFYFHYTRPNENYTKMHFEECRFFDLETRLFLWYYRSRYYFNNSPKNNPQQSTTMSSAESAKLRETLRKSEERERRWEQQRQEAVTYEQYLAMKEQGDIKQPELPT